MEWSDDELVASWTLVGEDWSLVGNKTGATRLGFAVLLKFFEIEARFPRAAEEVPPSAVAYVAEQLAVDAGEFATYGWSGRTIEYHRAQVRAAFGFREFARGDEDKLAGWPRRSARSICGTSSCVRRGIGPVTEASQKGSMCGSDCAASGGSRRRCGEDVETSPAAPSQGQMRPPWPHHTKETQHDDPADGSCRHRRR